MKIRERESSRTKTARKTENFSAMDQEMDLLFNFLLQKLLVVQTKLLVVQVFAVPYDVACAANRRNEFGSGFPVDFVAKVTDVNVNGIVFDVMIVTPDFADDLIPAHDFVCVLHQSFEQKIFCF